jgi:hypothetical protein
MKVKEELLDCRTSIQAGSIAAFAYYRELLRRIKVTARDHTLASDGDPTCLEHLLWMCEHCLQRLRHPEPGMDVGKYSRWLGYVQGCLICRGVTTVLDERERSRAWFTSAD